MIDPLIPVRFVHFAATLLASGTAGFIVLTMEPAFGASAGLTRTAVALRRRLTAMTWIALAVAVLSGLVWLALVAADILGAPLVVVWVNGGLWQIAGETRFGQIAIARSALAILLALLLLWQHARWLTAASAAAFSALLAFAGHAGAAPGLAGQINLVSDVAHLVAAAAWLGGLPALGLLLALAREPACQDAVAYATRRFSIVGIVSVGALMASGTINSWNSLSTPSDLATTPYGRLIAGKIILFAAMIAIAAANKFRLTPSLAAPDMARRLRRNVWIETAIGVAVVMLVAVLGTMAPASHIHIPSTAIPEGAAYVHIHDSQAMADVTVDPGRTGPSTAIIRVLREDFSDYPARNVTFALQHQDSGPATVRTQASHMPDGTWRAENLVIPQRGIWTVRVTVTAQNGTLILLDAPIVIDP